jgi:hypothetical protein
MARQRFIWPDLWTNPGFGQLEPLEQVLYIGCFSNADDHGRLRGDTEYLKANVLPRSRVRNAKIRAAREHVCEQMNLTLYVVDGLEYLAFPNWAKWQKPKYPSASRLPAPPGDSGNSSSSPSGNVSPNGSVSASASVSATSVEKSSSSEEEPSFLPPEPKYVEEGRQELTDQEQADLVAAIAKDFPA